MALSLVREADGNVVLSADYFQLRFFTQWGGAPQEFWQAGMPGPLTNSFAGSGCSLNFETGQDPTQATSNAFTPNPVSRIDQPGDRFYLREVLFDPKGSYGIQCYIPDFWASIEAIDDYDPDTIGSTGWRTKYNPGYFAQRLAGLDCPVIFDGTFGAGGGIFCVGNEMENNTLRNYKGGWIAFKTHVGINDDHLKTSLAGLLFQKTIPAHPGPSKTDLYNAPGLHLLFNSLGGWALHQNSNPPIVSGNLTPSQLTKLLSTGLGIEVRTNPGIPQYLELRISYDDPNPTERTLIVVRDTGFTPSEDTFFGFYSSATNGYTQFFYRQLWDLNAKILTYYFALPGQKILSHQNIVANDLKFYRANMPGIFLNATLYNPKSCGYIDHSNNYHEFSGVKKFSDAKSFWAGNIAGNLGVLATPKEVLYNEAPSPEAHGLVSTSGYNNEMVLMLNPFPEMWNLMPQTVRNCTLITEWQTHRTP